MDPGARQGGRAGARARRGRPEPRAHRGRRPRDEVPGRRAGPAVRERDRQPPARPDQPVRLGAPHLHGARHRFARGAGRADRRDDGAPAAPGDDREGQGAGQAARAGVLLREDGQGGALPGGLARRARPGPAPDPHLLAGRRRPVRHAAARLQPRPGHRCAQLRHVPDPEAGPAHRDDALADPQGRRRPPARLARARAGGGRDRHPPRHHVLGHRAPAPGDRRDDLRRVPARPKRGDGGVPDRRPRGARRVRGGAGGLRRRRHDLRPEGPFGDHTGFYTPVDDYPTFHLTGMSMRRDADLQHHDRRGAADGGLLARQGHRAPLPAHPEDDAAGPGGHEPPAGGRVPQLRDRRR